MSATEENGVLKRGSRARQLPSPQFEKMESRLLLSLLGMGDLLGPPEVSYDATGTGTFVAATDSFDVDGAPLSIVLELGQRPLRILDPRDFQMHIKVADDGALLGGVAGNDLYLQGKVVDRTNVVYDGVLLTGEIVAYGELNAGTGLGADKFDFRFTPTGGLLMPFFQDFDIGVDMTLTYFSTSTPYDGSFAVDFNGHAQGVLGVVEKLIPPPPEPGSLSGAVLAEGTGLAGVSISLTGTDLYGNTVNLSTVTNDQGQWSFLDLLPGTYSVAEAQPAGYLDGSDAAGSLGGTAGNDLITQIVVGEGQDGTGYLFTELTPSSLAGSVTVDGVGLGGVTLTLTGTDDLGAAVSESTITAADGTYRFESLRPGTYTISETQPANYLDGDDAVGSLGGTLGDDVLSDIVLASAQDGTGYNFTEIVPASLSGFVYEDFNNDGEIDFNEKAIEGVTVTLTGIDDRGQAVQLTTVTDSDGVYYFVDLRPGTYALTETQPAGFSDGLETLGTAGGIVGEDQFTGIALSSGIDGLNYNFGERPLAGSAVARGQTATIGFWQNKNGQNLLKALNGSANSTQLGDWLAATMPMTFGNLAGKTNAQVAQIYIDAFKAKKGKQDLGPAKLDCQVMATAFAVYVTNQTLAGTTAAAYGFMVTETGVGTATFNVGLNGAAFDVANYTVMTVLDLLLATEAHTAQAGVLYSYSIVNPDGSVSYGIDAVLRAMANEVYTAINEAGDIG